VNGKSLDQRVARLHSRAAATKAQRGVGAPVFVDPSFPEQAAFVADPSQLKMLLCTRRAGKSYGAGLCLYEAAWSTPDASCLYIALTKDSAREIMWRDVLKRINTRLRVGAKPNETRLTMTLPNGSTIKLLGMDVETIV
jgi:hypothetical protein